MGATLKYPAEGRGGGGDGAVVSIRRMGIFLVLIITNFKTIIIINFSAQRYIFQCGREGGREQGIEFEAFLCCGCTEKLMST